jgi:Raf kinase inhibitor-like YbhB/YbcL family protein
MMRIRRNNAALVIVLAAYVACIAQEFNESAAGGAPMAFTVKSSAFAAGAEIPKKFTCEAVDTSPALEWSGVPAKTNSLALIVDDPDAPAGTWVHWVLWNLPVSVHSLPEGVPNSEQLDSGARQGRNDFRKIGYNGPCPPPGTTHRYFFRLYALDVKVELAPGATRQAIDAAMRGHILAQAEYMGTFQR